MLKPSLNTLTIGQQPRAKSRSSKRDRIPEGLIHRRIASKRTFGDGRKEKLAIEHLVRLPEPGESFHFVIDGRFEPCDLIPAVRRLADPATIARLDLTTLGFNVDNVGTLARGLDQGKIGTALVVCSHYFKSAERPLYEQLHEAVTSRGGRVFGLRVHSKIMLFEMSDGRCFVVEGSGNLRSCKSIEQFVLTHDRDLLQFHRGWLEEYATASGRK